MSATFRPEIAGLRGVAAILVAVYHIWFGRVSGGVDVFLVVSGFLITHSLVNRLAQQRRLDVAGFLWDLYARLAPPALLVIAMTAVGSAFFLPRVDLPFNATEALSAALLVNNWHLAINAVDYLDRTGDPRPFQHFWALSVQWQFYFLWGGLFMVAQRLAPDQLRRTLYWLIGAVFVASLVYSIHLTAHNQPYAYFHTGTRVWEFAAGALLALASSRLAVAQAPRLALGWMALAAILTCGALVPVSASFPGYVALIPVIAALLLLAFGGEAHPVSVSRLLGSRPLQVLGRISYPLYLWHWPLLVLWLSYTLQPKAGLWDGLLILTVALLLATGTQALLSRPVLPAPRWPAGRLTVAFAGATVACCVVWRISIAGVMSTQLHAPPPAPITHPGAMGLGRDVPEQPVYPGPFQVRDEYPSAYREGCTQTPARSAVITCTYGDRDGTITLAAVGNSHITQWLPALDLAGRARGWKVILITKSDCTLRTEPAAGDDDIVRSCNAWNDDLVAVVRGLAPDFVFTAATRPVDGVETFPPDLVLAWRRLVSDPSRVLAVRATPRFSFDVPTCVDLHGAGAELCREPRSSAQKEAATNLRQQVEATGAHWIDLSRFFCDADACFPVAGNVLIYRDHNHLTPTYVRTMAEPLAAALAGAMQDTAEPPARLAAGIAGAAPGR